MKAKKAGIIHNWFNCLKQLLHPDPQNKDELLNLLREAQIHALIDAETLAMIEGVILFSQMQVRDIMLPKKQMVCISYDASLDNAIYIITQSGHSRFPVIDNKNEVIGILHAKDLLPFKTEIKDDYDLLNITRKVTFVPESKRLDLLLREFRSNRNHMAIVVDEYGEVSGFVSIEDIIEQIIGDIEDEFDIDAETYIKTHKDAHYIIKAHTPIEIFNQHLKTSFSDASYDTIGGIIMINFGYLPKRGETIIIENLQFKIINADARRIKLIDCIDLRDITKL